MSRDEFIKLMMDKRSLLLRNPKNLQKKRVNVAYKEEIKNLEEHLEDEGLDIDIMSHAFVKNRDISTSNIVDNYSDINAEKLHSKSWKDRFKKKRQFEDK